MDTGGDGRKAEVEGEEGGDDFEGDGGVSSVGSCDGRAGSGGGAEEFGVS